MSDAYDKAKESTPLNVQIEVLEDLLAIERLEIQSLKKELEQVKKLNIDDVSKPLPDGDDIWCKASEMSRDNFADWYDNL